AGPVAPERGFDTGADGPAGLRAADGGRRRATRSGLDIAGCDTAIGNAAGEVGQNRSRGPSNTRPRGAEPAYFLRVHAGREEWIARCIAGVAGGLSRTVDVGLHTEQHVSELPVVARLRAANDSGRREVALLRRTRSRREVMCRAVASESAAGIHAEIEAGPVVGHRQWLWRRFDGHVGGERGHGEE